MDIVLILPVLLFSVVVHEVAHGWVALQQGDRTAYMLGRITLNPIPHIDPFGTIILPAMLYLMGLPVLGMARPVPVNSRNFRNFRKGDILVSLAGVAANVLLAIACTLLTILFVYAAAALPSLAPTFQVLQRMFWYGVAINLLLAFFNLIPIPPLDGSHVLYYLLPPAWGMHYRRIGQYGILLVLLLLAFPPAVRLFLWPADYLQGIAQALVSAVT